MQYHPIQYNSFFYSNLCHVCKKADKNIKRCAICKSLAYCSKEHQIQDWPLHKELCKVIAETDKTLPCELDKFDHNDFKVTVSVLWKKKLGRELNCFEEQIWMFPRVCVVCYSKNIIMNCENCLNVAFCSEAHKNKFKEQHSKYCDALRLCMDIDVYYFHGKYRPTQIKVKVFDEAVKVLPNNLQQLMALYDDDFSITTLDDKIQFIIKTDFVAPAAIILYGLEKSGMISDRTLLKKSLSVHIVGADQTEMGWLWKIVTELPFHWIKNLSSLDYFVIGPDLGHDGVSEKFAEQLCEQCKQRKPKTSITFHSKLYHEVIGSLKKPDIVVAFNSGLHEFHLEHIDRWKESINCLTKYPNVPLILTAYTLDESKQDVNIVTRDRKKQIRTILEPQQNPFSNMRPRRDWENENTPFYVNGYIAILSSVT